jgi:DeoR family fructose operon transcriptional repressor
LSKKYIPAERQQIIWKMALDRGSVSVSELSGLLQTSELTIRRDLDLLEQKSLVERTHGGAIVTHRMRVETVYSQKNQEFRAEKEAIGRAAAQLIEPRDTILANSGSTVLQVIDNITADGVTVITNNAGALFQAARGSINLILIGGEYRIQSHSLVGGLARLALDVVYGSKAVIGIDAFSAKAGLTNPVEIEAEINRSIIQRTRGPVIVVADHHKLGVVSNFQAAPIEAVNILVTDEGAQEEYLRDVEKLGIEIIVATVSKGCPSVG